jgi:hypothetical protein
LHRREFYRGEPHRFLNGKLINAFGRIQNGVFHGALHVRFSEFLQIFRALLGAVGLVTGGVYIGSFPCSEDDQSHDDRRKEENHQHPEGGNDAGFAIR